MKCRSLEALPGSLPYGTVYKRQIWDKYIWDNLVDTVGLTLTQLKDLASSKLQLSEQCHDIVISGLRVQQT